MKYALQIIAFLWTIAAGILAIWLNITGKINTSVFGILLGFVIVVGIVIAFHNRLMELKTPGGWGHPDTS